MTTPAIRRVTVSYDPPSLFTNGLAIDDLEFSTEGPPPPCAATDVPAISLTLPTVAHVSRNKFLLEGSIDARGGSLSSAVLTVTSASGATKTLNLLGGIVKPVGGSFGAVWIYDMLFAGANTVGVTIANCRGSNDAAKPVTFHVVSPTTRFKLLHMEVTQATQTMIGSVALIADKPTVVRAFLRITGQTDAIRNVGGVLTAVRPGGSRPPGPSSVRSVRTVYVTPDANIAERRLDLTRSLNFRLPDEWLRAGRLHFEISALDIEGEQSTLPCDGCDNQDAGGFPVVARFEASRRLNILLAPYRYDPNADGIAIEPEMTTMPALTLQWVNNVFPLAGNFPDNNLGINVVGILPVRTTVRDLSKSRQQGEFLEDLSVIRSAWLAANPGRPANTHVLAIVPCDCGGVAYQPGYVAMVDTRSIAETAVSSLELKGQVWAHELGHNFGRKHANEEGGAKNVDKNFPYEHGGIGQPGLAIGTHWWSGSPWLIRPGGTSSHAHDFMSYGTTRPWVSPYTYDGLAREASPVHVHRPERAHRDTVGRGLGVSRARSDDPSGVSRRLGRSLRQWK